MSPSSSRSGGGGGASELAQLRRRQRLGAGGRRAPRPTPASRSRGRGRAPSSPRRADHLDRIAVRRDARRPGARRAPARRRAAAGPPRPRAAPAARRRRSGSRARSPGAGRRPARRRAPRHLADEGERAVQGHPAPRPRRAELREALLDPRGRLRPDPRHAVEPPCRRRLAQLRQRPDPERMAELAHPLRRDAEQRRDADELRQRLRLQLVQLGDPAGLDELAQPRLDSGADPGQLAHAALAHERGDVGRRRADQVGRAAVRAHGVVAGAVQVEQGGEGLEALGEGRVVHD